MRRKLKINSPFQPSPVNILILTMNTDPMPTLQVLVNEAIKNNPVKGLKLHFSFPTDAESYIRE